MWLVRFFALLYLGAVLVAGSFLFWVLIWILNTPTIR